MTFVGRDAQLAALRACAEDAAGGQARIVWIEGEAGAGKTALLDRAVEALPPEFTVLRAEADELGGDVAFGVVGQLAHLTATAPFAAGLELVDRWSAEDRPVAVVVEDLHWADAPSREALLTAARRLSRDRVLLVVASRPGGDVDGWERLRLDPRRCTRIEVGALTVAEVGVLAASYGVPLPARAAERLHRHTGGLALYVRTLLAELDPARLVEGDGDLPHPAACPPRSSPGSRSCLRPHGSSAWRSPSSAGRPRWRWWARSRASPTPPRPSRSCSARAW